MRFNPLFSVNIIWQKSVFWWHPSMGCYLISFTSHLQLLFSFVLLLRKLMWVLNICKNVSILSGQPAPGASLSLFLKAEGNCCLPNCSQNTEMVGPPLPALLAALLAHSWGSAGNPVICQKAMLNWCDLSYFWPLFLLFECLVLSLVLSHVMHCAGRTGLTGALWPVWVCDLCGLQMCEDGLTMGVFELLRKEREAHTLHLKKLEGKRIVHSLVKSLLKGVLAQ